ncbi:hypothetical protein L596_017959 [Steinernema carpocapsae]|uniref:Uncharacterized protein n=1 Tax=Steinernema carpocapsae TaxID=34508 RepID=A0A4U5N372_STECR|nr:hypothetical protein L596_017959 [Steinernema carpocapsae]
MPITSLQSPFSAFLNEFAATRNVSELMFILNVSQLASNNCEKLLFDTFFVVAFLASIPSQLQPAERATAGSVCKILSNRDHLDKFSENAKKRF